MRVIAYNLTCGARRNGDSRRQFTPAPVARRVPGRYNAKVLATQTPAYDLRPAIAPYRRPNQICSMVVIVAMAVTVVMIVPVRMPMRVAMRVPVRVAMPMGMAAIVLAVVNDLF